MEYTLRTCRNYAATFGPRSGNLLFSGDTGLGKTFLSACIARTVADGGHSVVYESAGHLFGKLERARFGGSEEERKDAEKYTACDLLILDDLGTEMGGQFVTAALYSLINDRMLAGKATIISTNLTVDELSRRYNPQIASRLRGGYTRVAFLGDDIRVVKNRRM
jgi:DNA replication protein DnaC